VSRTFYARGQTGQQLLLGAYQALAHQISLGTVQMFPRTEMLDLAVVDGHAKGIVVRDLVSGQISSHAGDTVVLATGGYSMVFYLSTNAIGCSVSATYRAYKQSAFFANPCYTQIHPTCIRSVDHINRSSRSCRSRCAMTAASGCRSRKKVPEAAEPNS
jgi:succinate dehydrogenase / fumarate reductase, flavoprotein subunit